MSYLFFQTLPPNVKEFEMTSPSIVFGRSDKANIQFPDEHCSKSHCRVTLLPSGLIIEDMGSKNGTYLNGLKITRTQFYIGDIIRIGDTSFKILPEKCSSDLLPKLTFQGDKDKRMSQAIAVGGQTKIEKAKIKDTPASHQENLTQLRLNPLFKDAALNEKKKK